jgi:hypothetical protein
VRAVCCVCSVVHHIIHLCLDGAIEIGVRLDRVICFIRAEYDRTECMFLDDTLILG